MVRIKEARKKCGLTQVALASMLGITQATLSGWETGKFQADNASLLRLSEILNTSVDDLLGRTELDLRKKWLDLPEERKKELRKIIYRKLCSANKTEAATKVIDGNELALIDWSESVASFRTAHIDHIIPELLDLIRWDIVDFMDFMSPKSEVLKEERIDDFAFAFEGEISDFTEEEKRDLMNFARFIKSNRKNSDMGDAK